MTAKSEEIKKWEAVEVDRSVSEAQKISTENLIVGEKNINSTFLPRKKLVFTKNTLFFF